MPALRDIWGALVTRVRDWREGRAPLASPGMKLSLVLALAGGLAWFVLGDQGLLVHTRLRGTLDSLENRSRQLQARIEWYRSRTERLKANDAFTLEEEARLMGMARPGEEILRIALPADSSAKAKSATPGAR